MGALETAQRKRAKKANLKRAILASVQLAGLLAMSAVVPNALRCLADFGFIVKKRHKGSLSRSCLRLIDAGLLQSQNGSLRLTVKGEAELRKFELPSLLAGNPKSWDGKWRVLIFDIKEGRKVLREKVRFTLVELGFARLQDSVWVFPYDCEDLIALLKADFMIGNELLYMIVDSIEADSKLRSIFNLPFSEA